MSIRLNAAALAAALILSACGNPDGSDQRPVEAPEASADYAVAGMSARASAPPPPPAPPPTMAGGNEPQAEQAVLLAYTHNYGLRLPSGVLADVYEAHREACAAAGGNVCRVISATINDPDGERPSGTLDIRARPDWIASFRDRLAGEVSEAGGNIQSQNTNVDDLTTQIVDGEARLRAQTALRDRLQALLETSDGPMADVLAVERELARVQSDIDARASVIAALRTRVETSRLTLYYQPIVSQTSPVRFNPIMDALEDFTDTLSEGVASVIRFVAGILPWLILVIPAIFLIRWLLARRKRKSA
ncbi:MAG: DUF4349 domain-containing protein [Caulobacterales bacterium]|uniref:DUF4349 domain-containing protein n=1 Tax=Glycocaulis sp. TaxID=1969725 RepID=UPI003FA0B076